MSKNVQITPSRTITDAQSVRLARKAVELELEKRKALDLPIAVYDTEDKQVYACFADGTKIPMSEYEKRAQHE
ncbi:hypothetical protein AALA24_07275 [Anaerovoracaceae bacterium 42-11]